MSFIHPGDYWIVAVTAACIYLIAARKLVIICVILTVVTSAIIYHGYGLGRLLLHVAVVVALIVTMRYFVDKSKKSE
jgi:hypothetical protein